ncbi:hypothetical protein [Aeromonas salmonicida]|nr:hypothetical protein [Aeromonas salmonicida]WCH39447.1 hypothetical protein ONZ57_19315 [Aeromonas salmonicida]
MSRKPDRITAMQQIIDAVKQEFPLYQPDTFRWALLPKSASKS